MFCPSFLPHLLRELTSLADTFTDEQESLRRTAFRKSEEGCVNALYSRSSVKKGSLSSESHQSHRDYISVDDG